MSYVVHNAEWLYDMVQRCLPVSHVLQSEPCGWCAMLTLGYKTTRNRPRRFRALMRFDGTDVLMPYAPNSLLRASFRDVPGTHRSAVKLVWVPDDGRLHTEELSVERAVARVVETVVAVEVLDPYSRRRRWK